MRIKVKNADWSAVNLGNIGTYGVINLNKFEGGSNPLVMSSSPETTARPAVMMKNNVENPNDLEYVHSIEWTTAIHGETTNAAESIYLIETSLGDVIPKSVPYLQIGFWVNRKYYDLAKQYNAQSLICVELTRGRNAAINAATGTAPNIFVENTYTPDILSGQQAYINSETINVKHLATMEIDGEEWVYVNLIFEMDWAVSDAAVNIRITFFRIPQYFGQSGLSEMKIPISNITVTTSSKELVPSYIYPYN